MTYNILYGGYQREAYILQVITTNDPDIVLLQEAGNQKTIFEFAKALDMHLFIAIGRFSRHPIALLSRFPIVKASSFYPFPPISRTVLSASLEIFPEKHLQIYGTHLVPHPPQFLLELWRVWEIHTILKQARVDNNELCLIAGDFNAVAPGDNFSTFTMPLRLKFMLWAQGGVIFRWAINRLLVSGFTDSYRFLHSNDEGYTLPTFSPTIRLDYIFVNSHLKEKLIKCHVVTSPSVVAQASDHYPIIAEFSFL